MAGKSLASDDGRGARAQAGNISETFWKPMQQKGNNSLFRLGAEGSTLVDKGLLCASAGARCEEGMNVRSPRLSHLIQVVAVGTLVALAACNAWHRARRSHLPTVPRRSDEPEAAYVPRPIPWSHLVAFFVFVWVRATVAVAQGLWRPSLRRDPARR